MIFYFIPFFGIDKNSGKKKKELEREFKNVKNFKALEMILLISVFNC